MNALESDQKKSTITLHTSLITGFRTFCLSASSLIPQEIDPRSISLLLGGSQGAPRTVTAIGC